MKNMDQKIIKDLLQKENPIILEVGAHLGEDTKRFLYEFKNLKIYCFEPDPRCIKKFKENINDNRCILIESAVSNKDGETTLYMSGGIPPARIPRILRVIGLSRLCLYYYRLQQKDWDASSSIKKCVSRSERYPWLTFNKKIEVKTIKLDTWARENNVEFIDFLWVDVQGAERELIEGAVDAFKIINYFYTEYGETSPYPGALTKEETIKILEGYNFELIEKYSSTEPVGNLLFKNKVFD